MTWWLFLSLVLPRFTEEICDFKKNKTHKISEKHFSVCNYKILAAYYNLKSRLKLYRVNNLRLSSGANRKLSLPVDPGINPKSLFSCLSLFLGTVYCTAPPVGFNLIYTHPDINYINLTCSISRVRNKRGCLLIFGIFSIDWLIFDSFLQRHLLGWIWSIHGLTSTISI